MATLLLLSVIWGLRSADSKVTNYVADYPPMWDLVPGKLSDFSIHNNKVVVINPWNYLGRMGMYKILLNVTAPFLDMKEPDNKENILWGLPLQHGWQFHTGRLKDKSKQPACGQNDEDQTCISVRSWWACMNYYLAVIPFLGAFDAGLFESFPYELDISPPEEFEFDFCYNITECRLTSPRAMDGWTAFFKYIKTPNQISNNSLPPLSKEEGLLSYMWRAHVESINVALPRCSKRLSYLSAPERDFGVHWATTVEFIAATNFPTDFQNTNEFQAFLPHRMLADSDAAPFISDFSEQKNKVLVTLGFLNRGNTFTGGFLLKQWKKAMCSEQGRAEGRNFLQHMITGHMVPQTLLTILKEFIKNHAC